MTPSRTSPRALALLPVLVLALVLASGCGTSTDDPPGAAGTDRARDRSAGPDGAGTTPSAPAPSPTSGAGASSPAPSRSATPGGTRLDTDAPAQRPSGRRTVAEPAPVRPRGNALTVRESGPDGHLIAADALGPGWRVVATGDEDGRVTSPCHRATLVDVGAQQVRLRDFEGPGRAVQAVARFVDRRSAWRIERVVSAWVSDCERGLERRDAALGAVRQGRWLAVVEVSDHPRAASRLDDALAAARATF